MGLGQSGGGTTVVYQQPVVSDATPAIAIPEVDAAEQARRLNISESKKVTNNILSGGSSTDVLPASPTLLRRNVLGAG